MQESSDRLQDQTRAPTGADIIGGVRSMQYNRWLASLYSAFADPWLREVRCQVLELSGVRAGSMALDVCCGTGEQSIVYARTGARAFGVDISPGMIAIAEKKRQRTGLANLVLQSADAQELPFESGLFDCVSISLALHEIERPVGHRILAEMTRVLKSDGVLVFNDFQAPLPAGPFSSFIWTVEFLAGHADLLRDFVDNGGLETLLEESRLVVDGRVPMKKGHLVILGARTPSHV